VSILNAEIPENAPPELKAYMEIKQFIADARDALRLLHTIINRLENAETNIQAKAMDHLDEDGQLYKKYHADITASAPVPELPPGKRGCGNCGRPGHRKTSCPHPSKTANTPMGKRTCSICRKSGHKSPRCPQKG
jgi:hypothetical protein